MSTLLILLPAPARLHASASAAAPAIPGQDYEFLLSGDGRHVQAHGRKPLAELPTADRCVLLLPDEALSWQRVDRPKATGPRLRAALAGLLEDRLLEDTNDLHFALAPQGEANEPTWVAVCRKATLQAHLAAMEQARRDVDRVLPLSWPGAQAQGFFLDEPGTDRLWLRYSGPDGAATLPLQGGGARQWLGEPEGTRWLAAPAAAQPAEAWLGAAVAAQTRGERALAALGFDWDLRQFELAPRTRGLRQLKQAWRSFMEPGWRPVRWGLAGLLLVQLLGLNLWAWQQRHQLAQRHAAMSQLLTQAFPKVQAVYDAPLQMGRELDLLRATAGQLGDGDLERQLAVLARAWPDGGGAPPGLEFSGGRLTLATPGLSQAQIAPMKQRLAGEGWLLEAGQGRISLSRQTKANTP
ncbi:type II secretion system protein GspL [Pelomonas sp. CA6]|uniref:type II secretion system protein GspL n=1 Tax=Pelomonas sp. CA6 TaxID=2907999 RepID=UPI001F4C13FB|nr:type II secretion system protein GspL [Pelomonas sp. CA6]MCH7343266.1 type II secretion system protein GspL [Pelomonas sp. CA6]